MESMMPKQQIYAYKCFVLLGDIYNDIEYYDLSTTCYELSIAIANTKSHFHTLDISGKDKCFKELISLCMPQQPVFLKLINCAAKYNDEQKIQEYFWKLKNMNI